LNEVVLGSAQEAVNNVSEKILHRLSPSYEGKDKFVTHIFIGKSDSKVEAYSLNLWDEPKGGVSFY
jgi:hypothetical protein